jgi:aerobic carbon-monoxide dehydrogenase small subunit
MTESPQDGAKCEISFQANGRTVSVQTHSMERLLDVLRHELGLTGVKEGCGEGECGSCAVLADGKLVNSCLIPALQANGSSIVTVEGLAADGRLSALQEAFLACGGAQCGICTPGMLLAAHHLLSKKPNPSLEEVREALTGNLCRCTGYMQIFEAVMKVADRGGSA